MASVGGAIVVALDVASERQDPGSEPSRASDDRLRQETWLERTVPVVSWLSL